jgi:hypothetical protein
VLYTPQAVKALARAQSCWPPPSATPAWPLHREVAQKRPKGSSISVNGLERRERD